uniref:ATP-dependent Clp protease proteolytic subunit n=2 Tax=Pseudotaxus chienii TaxID=89481 RepID=A0A3S9AFQ8_9CONI|nr:ATP-dependent Clp protease proteolytic subunit [Pseudotaxus chienii]AZN62473.1 ClpP [Pseudotaxus chienii]QBK34379.1 ATP-dependent Clp protease proteolytic subunit [Pseudotaxus chienii]QBK36429.1 ATP-dependent Clp protease proteolytic subunit [Pseudotaxus chienii]QVX28186.1 Clp protease proteolytic subunit [Pseudotaxus chienii]QYB22333.1 clp protease proteolytic subunit [Pseudotaxus chienii]
MVADPTIPKVPFEVPSEEEPTWVEVFYRLFRGRILFLGKPLDDESADAILKSMVYLNQENPTQNLYLFTHCRGGGMASGVAIYDFMQYLTGEVITIGVGLNASMGAFILHGGTRGKRAITPNGRMMIHQPYLSSYDDEEEEEEDDDDPDFKFEDPGFEAFYLRYLRQYITNMYVETSGTDYDTIHSLMERDHYLDPHTSVNLGLVDQVGTFGLWPPPKEDEGDEDYEEYEYYEDYEDDEPFDDNW